jgi:hypothetical protein
VNGRRTRNDISSGRTNQRSDRAWARSVNRWVLFKPQALLLARHTAVGFQAGTWHNLDDKDGSQCSYNGCGYIHSGVVLVEVRTLGRRVVECRK